MFPNALSTLNYLSAPMSTEEGRRHLSQTRALLSDMACFMDLSSETAEVLHAQNRSSFLHVSGRYKDAQRCQEQSYINSINDEYLRICDVINSETMPKKRSEAQIRRMLKEQVTGPSSCAQRTRKSFRRKACAWNLFERHHMEGLTLSKVEWKKKTKDLAKSWRSFTAAQKMPFRIAAQTEQLARSKLQEQPLPCRRESAAASSDQQVKYKTRRRLNLQRLSLNEQQRQVHPAFHGQALFDHKYALKAEHMETVQNLESGSDFKAAS